MAWRACAVLRWRGNSFGAVPVRTESNKELNHVGAGYPAPTVLFQNFQ